MESLKESYFFAQYKKEFGDQALPESSKLIFDLFLFNHIVENIFTWILGQIMWLKIRTVFLYIVIQYFFILLKCTHWKLSGNLVMLWVLYCVYRGKINIFLLGVVLRGVTKCLLVGFIRCSADIWFLWVTRYGKYIKHHIIKIKDSVARILV
jgi:hypothetical protein